MAAHRQKSLQLDKLTHTYGYCYLRSGKCHQHRPVSSASDCYVSLTKQNNAARFKQILTSYWAQCFQLPYKPPYVSLSCQLQELTTLPDIDISRYECTMVGCHCL
ncbi:hypothetical protein J6590_069374 [Homalodisca vitripennis]|nr:hypothetical protein J6590_069374 [Homalodisca vitripennis]